MECFFEERKNIKFQFSSVKTKKKKLNLNVINSANELYKS